MANIIIYKEKIHSVDPRLKRIIHHDSRSKLYKFDTTGRTISSVVHTRNIPILDQGRVGSCTGNAGIGALGSNPFYNALPTPLKYPLDQTGALALYSDAQVIDGNGPYPPNDFGSSGLSIAKALKNSGIISGYQHTFTLDDALKALTVTPITVGMYWYQRMSVPDRDGRARVSGRIYGGHQVVAREIDAQRERVWFDNSWGSSWGVKGRFYLKFNDFGTLLAQQGDVVTFTSINQAPPQPTPDADMALSLAMKTWLTAKGLQ